VTYTGETDERGEAHGQGVYEWGPGEWEGDRYEGQWKDDKQHGQGVYEFASGDRYEGQWKDDRRNGQGAMKYVDGTRYEGQQKANSFHGRMFTTRSDGSSFTTLWENGELVSTEDIQSMSRDELTLELLKLRERVNELSKSDQKEDSGPN